jgi:TonB-linked SusC/RagA family outer membrane protein
MKKLFSPYVLILACILHWGTAFGQSKEITGTVTSSEDGSTLPGVNVFVKGGTNGTTTQIDGTYKLKVADTDPTLVFTMLGMQTVEMPIGASLVIDVKLAPEKTNLKEVVVGALGIEKKARGLTYATQEISGKEVSEVKEVNFVNSLAGKVAGVVVTRGSSGVGSSSKVVLRGNKSIMGNNQALYVIDGIPMNDASAIQPITLYNTFDGGDAISNLNPDDIESVNILKGASAAALYGSQAANGVIIVTTKKGKDGAKVNFSSSTTFENAIALPKIQTKYGSSPADPTSKTAATDYVDSWGAKGTASGGPTAKDFFKTGVNYINSISLSNGNEHGSFFLSYANTKANGIMPENKLTKHNANVRASTKLLNDKLSLDGSVKLISQDVENRPNGGYSFNPLVGLYLFPSGKNFSQYDKDHYETVDINGQPVQNWFTNIPNEGLSSQNPYWIAHRNTNSSKRNRVISALSAQYAFTDWFKIMGRVNYDRTGDDYEQKLYATTDQLLTSANGEYTKNLFSYNQLYSDFIASFNKNLSENVSLQAAVGTSLTENRNSNVSTSSYQAASSSLTDPFTTIKTGMYYANYFSTDNLKNGFYHGESSIRQLGRAVFATATLGYKNMLFLDVTGRNEWSSTIVNPTKNPFFYPSVGVSYVLTESIHPNAVLSFAKLRATYAKVGNALPFGVANPNPPFSINTSGVVNPTLAKPLGDLVPEMTTSFEFGFDTRLFKDHVSINYTYYSGLTKDQLFTIVAPPGAGSSYYYVNGGDIRNSGFELAASYRTNVISGFSWESGINASQNKNKVIKLSDKLDGDQIVISDMSQTKIYQLVVKKDGSYGDMYGVIFKRDGAGNIVKDPVTGNPVVESGQNHYLGNANPKLLFGWANTFTYKGVYLKVLIDCRFGGQVASVTEAMLDQKGLSQRSADARDADYVIVGGTSFNPKKFYTAAGGSAPVSEQYIYDATNIRLREAALGYTFPKIKKLGVITFAITGRNLFFFLNKAPFDPDSSISTGNGLQGLNAYSMPTTRSIGFNLNLKF